LRPRNSYADDAAGNLVQTTLPAGNGYVESRAYDRAGRLVEVEAKRGAATLSRFAISLDPVGNPTQIVRTGSLAQTQAYTYDANDRLTSVCFQAGACPAGSDPFIRYTYDLVGNRLTEQRPGVATTSYAYDARDRLLQAGSTSYTWDQNGNQLAAGSRTFAYDLGNRLRSTTQGSTTTTYLYDGDGLRQQAATGAQAAKKTSFLWDASVGLPQLAQERDGAGALLRRYTYGIQRISMTSGTSTSYYLRDGLGSTANLTSASGQTQWTYAYEPFGLTRSEQKAPGNQPTNLLEFTGEYLDPTGLYHLRARQYDPQLGRFLTRDPADQTVNESVVSAYAYVANRPTVMVDPSGETFQPSWRGLESARFSTSREDESSSTANPTGRRYGNCGVSWLYAFASRLRPGILTVAMGSQLYRRALRHSWKATVFGPGFRYSDGDGGFGPWSGRLDRSFAVRVPNGKFRVVGDLWAMTILGPCASGPLVDTETVG